MTLRQEILEILNINEGLKAKDIANQISIRFKEEVDKKEINRILYYELKDEVFQNSNYQWYLKNKSLGDKPVASQVIETPLGKLAEYYLDCLSRDTTIEISKFSTSRYGSPEYGQIFQLPATEGINEKEIFDSIDAKNTINKVKQNSKELILQLGYPIHVRKHTSNTGNHYFVEPLLLIPFDTNSFLHGGTPQLINEIPQFNREAVSKLSGLAKGELINEILLLSQELGFNNTSDDLPSFEEVFLRLKKLRTRWNWKEEIDPDQLSEKSLKELTEQGIYNCAGLFYTQRSKYTIGLEKELSDFKSSDIHRYGDSALNQWLSGFKERTIKDYVLIEPIPLNEEQKEAVKRALQSPITVVTGPPGTGKSQVVTSIIVNAIFNNQKVLFASKNNKAVDVVFERVNGLTSRPVMLRLGSEGAESNLISYLSTLLSSKTSQVDEDRFKQADKIHKELSEQLHNIDSLEAQLIKLRNLTDEFEQKIQAISDQAGYDVIRTFAKMDHAWLKTTRLFLDNLEFSWHRAEKALQPLVMRLFWFLFKEARFQSLNSHLTELLSLLNLLKIENNLQSINDNNIKALATIVSKIDEKLEIIDLLNQYHKTLKSLIESKSLFDLSVESKRLEEKIKENSESYWESWLNLMPNRISRNRGVIGKYLSLLTLITKAKADSNSIENSVYAQYYKLLPEVANVLSCWAVTSLSVKGKVPFESGFFDLVIIDEASQCDIASALPLLFRAKRAVIIGDEKQLNHITSISERQDIQLLTKYNLIEKFLNWSYTGSSLFGLAQSLCSSDDIIVLKDHHRSHADIINYSNKEFYGGYLRVATNYSRLKTIKNQNVVRWIDVKGHVESPPAGGSLNSIEAAEVIKELKRLVQIGYEGTIGVVSPFRAQAERINDLVNNDPSLSAQLLRHDFLVDTVHKFQGDERDIMIFSPVISEGISLGSISFLSRTGNLFNVAITRARAALITIGDKTACYTSGIKYMQNFSEYVSNLKTQENHDNLQIKDFGPKYPQLRSSFIISDWEKILYEALYKSGIKTIPQYSIEQYSLDLAYLLDGRKLDIEVDGERYHKNWDGELCKRDKLRNKRLIELGWDVKRFWVYEIKYNVNDCVNAIHDWINKTSNLKEDNKPAKVMKELIP